MSIEEELPLGTLLKNRIHESQAKSGNKTLWLILAICGFPFWLPILLSMSVTIIVLYLSIWIVILSLYIALLAFALCGVMGLFNGIVHCFLTGPVSGLMIIGISVMSIGLFLTCCNSVVKLSKILIEVTVKIGKKIKRLFITTKEAV